MTGDNSKRLPTIKQGETDYEDSKVRPVTAAKHACHVTRSKQDGGASIKDVVFTVLEATNTCKTAPKRKNTSLNLLKAEEQK